MKKLLVLFLLLTILLSGCFEEEPYVEYEEVPTTTRKITTTTSPKTSGIDVSQLEKDIHDLINEEREKQGLTTLNWDDELAEIARSHSRDMALNRYFAHEDLQGRDFRYRYEKAGYDCKILYNVTGGYWWYAMGAENIFQNNLYASITYIGGVPHYDWNTQEEIANSTVQGWMGSPGHRKNILISYWENEGIGIVIGVDDKIYITENFC